MKPNILLISSDQQRADCFGFKGRKIRTPNLDALAAAGTSFDACITPCVVCQPARASILTGQLPRTHGVHDNGIDLDPALGEQGFAGMLGRAGYDTAYFGKAHFSTYHTFEATGTPECLKSSASYPPDWNGPYMGFDHVELVLVGHNWWAPETPPGGQHYERFFHADGKGEEKVRLMWENGGDTKGAAQTWHSKLPVEWHNSTWIGDRACAFLEQDHDQPFCAWVSFPDPHHPFDCPEPWSHLHDPAEVDLPQNRTRHFDKRPWWHEQVLTAEPEGAGADIRKSYSRIPPQSDEQLREIIANTYGQIALIDHNVGRMLDTLEAQGLAENTIVIYISDHGDWLGDHGLILKGPMHYEGLLTVPMLVRGPGVPAGARLDTPVSTLDLLATFAELGATEPLMPTHGQSLVPVWEGRETRDFAMNEWELLPTRTGVALSLRTVRTQTHKVTVDLRSGAGELYDLVNDSGEMQNLWDDPATADVQARLMELVHSRPGDMKENQAQVGMA